jgi:hypothetical protein
MEMPPHAGAAFCSREIIVLIRKMSLANPRWGAPRIHGELLKLGFELSQATVAKYMVRRRKPSSQRWRTFLRNHMSDMVATDFFVVPTVFFDLLFVFVILSHDRRRVIHFGVTAYPTSEWPLGNCSRLFRGIARHGISCVTEMEATERSFVKRRTAWEFGRF